MNVTVPEVTPVTTPPFVTVAIEVLLLVQVPPELGESVVVLPTQILDEPVILTLGCTTTILTFDRFCPHSGLPSHS